MAGKALFFHKTSENIPFFFWSFHVDTIHHPGDVICCIERVYEIKVLNIFDITKISITWRGGGSNIFPGFLRSCRDILVILTIVVFRYNI